MRTFASCSARRCAVWIGSGMNSGVSFVRSRTSCPGRQRPRGRCRPRNRPWPQGPRRRPGRCRRTAGRSRRGRRRVVREALATVGVADLLDRVADDALDVELGVGADLAGDDGQAGVDEHLAGDARLLGVAVRSQGRRRGRRRRSGRRPCPGDLRSPTSDVKRYSLSAKLLIGSLRVRRAGGWHRPERRVRPSGIEDADYRGAGANGSAHGVKTSYGVRFSRIGVLGTLTACTSGASRPRGAHR